MHRRHSRFRILALLAVLPFASPAVAQEFTIPEVLSPAFPLDLVAADDADRIAWVEYERGLRNVWTAAAPAYQPVKLTDYTLDDGHDLTGTQVSDDGSVIMFIRGHEPNDDDWIANPVSKVSGTERAAWAVRSSGGEPWRIARAEEPVLSPDRRWIAYEKDDQIHRAPVDPAALATIDADTLAPLITAFGENEDPVWSPDSRAVAFVSDRGDHGYIGVYELGEARVRWMTPGVDFDDSPAWSPDGTRLAFIRRPGRPFGWDSGGPWWERDLEPDTTLPDGIEQAGFAGGHTLELWVADAETGEGHRVWHSFPGEERFTDIRSLRWVGDQLVFESEPGEWEGHYWAVSVSDPAREPVELTPNPGFVEHVAFSPDGRWIYYTTNADDIDRRDLWRAPIAGGEPERLTSGDLIETYPEVLSSGDVALLAAGESMPLTVALLDAGDDEARFIRALPDAFPRAEHVEPQNVVINAADGVDFHNQIFLPPDIEPGERRPALIFIHGGSRRQMLLGYHYMHFYHMAYAMNQYFANKGYVTMSVNYRSGIGYGSDFRDWPDYGRRGNAEYQDILAAGKYLQTRADVDPNRIGIWGLSYGGILTANALARNSDIFKAGVDMAGVHLYGGLEEPDSTLYQSSAISAIDGWTSPVLLIHGDDDRNVDFSQTVGLVQLLRAKGVDYELIVFPDDVHDSLLFSRWIESFQATDDFFDRKLLDGLGVADGEGSERN
ncbi:MAG: prolyl oligopeptidase family serine peptidase [Longimicrobiales bacterium]